MNRRIAPDFLTIMLYLLLAIVGWLTIYAVSSGGVETTPFDFSRNHGRQFMWIGISVFLGGLVLLLDYRFFETAAYLLYLVGIVVLVMVLLVGKEVNGAKSWLMLGPIQLQPSEFAKLATALALARYVSHTGFTLRNRNNLLVAAGIILLPAVIVLLQNDTGSALVFMSLFIVLFREGLNPIFPAAVISMGAAAILSLVLGPKVTIIGVGTLAVVSFILLYNRRDWAKLLAVHLMAAALLAGLAFSTDYIVHKLPEHQYNRIMVLIEGPEIDPQGTGYNVRQSMIAIGSGGMWGKGFVEGIYTKYDFVPKQVTDFIFCTIGEEQGWVGTTLVILLFFSLMLRVRLLAENSKTTFARAYGYGVISILFFHVFVNIGMTVNLVPVIGIPLPFFSYGGSSLLAFTLLIAVMLNLHSVRNNVLGS